MTTRRRWTPDELARFLARTLDTRLEPAWHLTAFAGLRVGELLALRWSDVDLDRLSITVRHAVAGVTYAALKAPPRANRARVIDLDSDLGALMRRHRERHQAERSEWGAYYGAHDLVVCDESGRPLHPRSLRGICCELAHRAELQPIELAAVRHSERARLSSQEAPA